MPDHDLSRFTTLINEHRSALHPLFSYIESAALSGSLTSDAYLLFSTNIASRTMLSLPEIHACCIQASLDLDPLRTAYSVMTGAEEGGFGKPHKVHTILMMNALNYHGRVVFGLTALDIRDFMARVRLLYTARRLRSLLELESSGNTGICHRLQQCGLLDSSELAHTCRRLASVAHVPSHDDVWGDACGIKRIEDQVLDSLIRSKVLPETIDYCLAQLEVLGKTRAGYLQGVGFAHEALADGMIYKMFRILYAQIDRYASRQEFMEHVYPYFAAHGDYIGVFDGVAENTEGVEVIHAQRELAKLGRLDSESLDAAWTGANAFADRNVRIWDGLMNALDPTKATRTTLAHCA